MDRGPGTAALILCVVVGSLVLSGCGTTGAPKVIVVTATPQSIGASSPPTPVPPAAPVATPTIAGESFTQANWAVLQTDPDSHKGARVDIVGRVFIAPQRDAKGTYWQMWSDPKNSDWNTLVGIANPDFQIAQDQYVRVIGTVKGKYEGTNAFGGNVRAVEVVADQATVVSALAAASPALHVVQDGASQRQNGITIAVKRIEFAADETRVFVTVTNGSSATGHFYDFNSKVVQGTTQYSTKAAGDYPVVQSDILPGVTSSGVLVFPSMDPSRATRLVVEAGSDNYNLTFQPYTFDFPAAGSPPRVSTASRALQNQADDGLIRTALRKSNQAWSASMRCACDRGLESIKTGSDLQSNLQSIQSLQRSGQRWEITPHSYSIVSIIQDSTDSATALVSKDETSVVYQGARKVQTCTGPYQVQYHLEKIAGHWKVVRTKVLGGGQTCH